jgi:Methylamine utilisation protein MauE
MSFSLFIIDARLFIRLFIGLILLSVSISKLIRIPRFQQNIRDYRILPSFIESKQVVTILLALGIGLGELVSGCGLITGIQLLLVVPFIQAFFALFSVALIINLVKGRKDLSCHCGGVLGDHSISWWLVMRNLVLIFSLFLLLATSPDPFTIDKLLYDRTIFTISMWINSALPVIIFTVAIFFIVVLFTSAKNVFGKKSYY